MSGFFRAIGYALSACVFLGIIIAFVVKYDDRIFYESRRDAMEIRP
jgi:hypothetical protein